MKNIDWKKFCHPIMLVFLFSIIASAQIGVKKAATSNTYNVTNDETTINNLISDSLLAQVPRALEFYGAVGDGITNDSAAVETALNSGLPIVGKSGSSYLVDGSITITDKDIDLQASGEEPFTFTKDDDVSNLLYFTSSGKSLKEK